MPLGVTLNDFGISSIFLGFVLDEIGNSSFLTSGAVNVVTV
ncbi:hypothetical protein bthur0001_53840 [Bacillus thuringiensis serovar tochigiensis BGSC 4Y1]|nr:hypothetical protein bthur0001_53840 [Bacillus thuringiensis serovar tochigiensis BGSC 4Y1]